MTEENIIWWVVDPITEEAMVTFSVKNIQVGYPKNSNIDGRKKFFFVLNVFNTTKKRKKTFSDKYRVDIKKYFCLFRMYLTHGKKKETSDKWTQKQEKIKDV